MILSPYFKDICKSYDLKIHCIDDTIVLGDSKSDAFVEISQDEYYTDSKKEKTADKFFTLSAIYPSVLSLIISLQKRLHFLKLLKFLL